SAYEVNGKKYFSKPDGSPYRNQVLTFGDKAYYMGADGSRQYGLIRSGNVTYYAHTGTGELLLNAGLFTVADSTFYSGSRYALSTGLLTFGDVAYYFDPQAEYPEAVKSTTRTINGTIYIFDSVGRGRASLQNGYPGEWTYSGGTIYGPAIRTRRVGSNHVVISLTHQYLWLFRNNTLVLQMPIVSGRPITPTVRGEFRIYSKERHRYLTGPDYRVPVNYWVPFYTSYGIHDASWQREENFMLDGNTYTWGGSHGCINVYSPRMPEFYNNVSVGTPVTIY
ncbi:MAG: L,D-transpeptidase family protein, partial [Peptoniphilaceae bacterium]|nr:L,D-transpeptidase family protein [Peptoniphilaceae bacterium]